MARLLSRLSAISVKTGAALPLFSWSLQPVPASDNNIAPHSKETPFADAIASAGTQDFRSVISTQVYEAGKNVFFMGEHHEQPRVLAAQLTILDELVKIGRTIGRPVVLVTEQFNILQQGMLSRFGAVAERNNADASEEETSHVGDKEGAEKLMEEHTGDELNEGFNLAHYMPLLLLARECRVKISGGFPPRSWARVVSKEGIAAMRAQNKDHLQMTGFDRWDDLECSPQHAAHIQSMIKGEAPRLASGTCDSSAVDIEKGLYPAQAFKDAVLAFTIDEKVRESKGEVLVLVVTGSGHCEYGFGAPERLRMTDKEQACIITCKSNEESTIWKGPDWGQTRKEDDRFIADAVLLYDQV